MGNDPFLGAGQNPARKGVVEGVRERAWGFLSFDKNNDKQNSCLCEKMDSVPSLF